MHEFKDRSVVASFRWIRYQLYDSHKFEYHHCRYGGAEENVQSKFNSIRQGGMF